MLKVVVFDSGWGGELVADFLEGELGVIEVTRVIDWRNAPYGQKTREEAIELTVQNLRPYIGRADLIVLGGYTASLALTRLRGLFPEQNFAGMGIEGWKAINTRNPIRRILALTDGLADVNGVRIGLELQNSAVEIRGAETAGWEKMIDDGEMTIEILREKLGREFVFYQAPRRGRKRKGDAPEEGAESENGGKFKPDVVLLLNTHFWEVKAELEKLFGWKVRVVDYRKLLLHDVCRALELRGVDGMRRR